MWYTLPRQAGLPGDLHGQLRWVLAHMSPSTPHMFNHKDYTVTVGSGILGNLRKQVLLNVLMQNEFLMVSTHLLLLFFT